jgi:hypothetical protein
MSKQILIITIVTHALAGIILPGILLWLNKYKEINLPRVSWIYSWILFSWSLFFFCSGLFIVLNFVVGGGKIGILIFVLAGFPFFGLAFAAFYLCIKGLFRS